VAANPWYRAVAGAFRTLYHHRITLTGVAPAGDNARATLYVASHRNGAVDGYVYMQVLPGLEFMLAEQLKRNPFVRLFFNGIGVVRDKDVSADTDQSGNAAALLACTAQLAGGGTLMVFPEGTSELGYRHLPFRKGAARIADACIEAGTVLRIAPVALHYEAAPHWQSDVDIWAGAPFELAADTLNDAPARARRINAIHCRIVAALEAICVDAPDAATFVNWERLAYAATLGTGRSYALALDAVRRQPRAAVELGAALDALIARHRPWLHQGVPVIAPAPLLPLYLLALLVRAPLALLAMLLNAPPLLAAIWMARRCADQSNVIALWRFVAGAPVAVLWWLLVAGVLIAIGHAVWLAPWALVTLVGVRSVYRARKLAVEVANALLRRAMLPELEPLRRRLGAALEGNRDAA
jgi:1-acyl-sn-glycerol-3-phosphate acyltransferase